MFSALFTKQLMFKTQDNVLDILVNVGSALSNGLHHIFILKMNDSFDKSPQKRLSTGPKTRVCYVCGRQYGLNSFEIHLKQCKELWIAREAEKDPRERKKLPEDPMLRLMGESAGGGGGGSSSMKGGSPMPSAKDLEEINKLSTAAFNTEALDTCEYCGRTFLPEKLVIHNRSCTAETPARKLTDGVKRGNGPYTPSVTPSKAAESATSTPVRPSSTARPRTNPAPSVRSSAEFSEQDGSLVGEGSTGRPRRSSSNFKSPGIASPAPAHPSNNSNGSINGSSSNGNGYGVSSRPATSTSTTALSARDIFNVSEFRDKEQVVEYLLQKLDGLENIATDLARSIIEIRSVVDQLR